MCPNLVSLKYDTNEEEISDETLNKKLPALLAPHINSHLKRLQLYMPFLRRGNIKYITESTFTQLDNAQITITEIDLHDWLEEVGLENSMKPSASIQQDV